MSIVVVSESFNEIEILNDPLRGEGNPIRIQKLLAAFGTSPGYGKGLDWAGYTALDAFGLLQRYLKALP